jgi:vacuolar-type H+-ATPase subunit E/Vma4
VSLEGILRAIDAIGEAELSRMRADAEAEAQRVRAEGEVGANARRAAARQTALRPAAGDRARRLHRARLEAVCLRGAARDQWIELVLNAAHARLADARAMPNYPLVLGRLLEAAVFALGEAEVSGSPCEVEVDPRDEALARRRLGDLGFEYRLTPGLKCWGGVVVRSGDGRIVVTNTLEARFERALPFLRQELAALLERAEALNEDAVAA